MNTDNDKLATGGEEELEQQQAAHSEDELADFDDTPAAEATQAGEGQGGDESEQIDTELLKAVAGEGDEARAPMIPKARFDEVNGELKELRSRVDAMQQERVVADARAQMRDFAAEKVALRHQRDGGELDDDEYLDKRDALVVEEAEQRALMKAVQFQQEQQREQSEQAWKQRIGEWESTNADFLANSIRRNAVASLLEEYSKDSSLSDADLLAKVEAEAFEAFGFAREVADATKAAGKDLHAARNAADAKAQANASTAPTFGAGSSDRGRKAVPGLVGLGDADWKNVPKEVRESDQLADF